jgi:Tetratricopeptide repeat
VTSDEKADRIERERGPRVRGAFGKLVKRGKAEIPVSQDPERILWQVEQFTERVEKKYGADSLEAARAQVELSFQLGKMGKWEEARRLREGSLASFVRHRGEDDPETLQIEMSLAMALAHSDRWSEAEGHLEHAAASSVQALGPDHAVTGQVQGKLDEFRQGRADRSSD